jgi:hypothetical protein
VDRNGTVTEGANVTKHIFVNGNRRVTVTVDQGKFRYDIEGLDARWFIWGEYSNVLDIIGHLKTIGCKMPENLHFDLFCDSLGKSNYTTNYGVIN